MCASLSAIQAGLGVQVIALCENFRIRRNMSKRADFRFEIDSLAMIIRVDKPRKSGRDPGRLLLIRNGPVL
jgi:hypothetical protein